MVSTRHSLPGASTAKAKSPIPTNLTPKAAKALKKLQIQGKDALLGDKKPASNDAETGVTEKRTYHYRGAVYEVDESTEQSWIEDQPKRYLKGNDGVAGVEEDAQAGAEEDEEEEEEQPPTKKSKRTSSAGRKRKRVSEPEPINTSKVFNFTDVGGREERPILDGLPSWMPETKQDRRARLAAQEAAGIKRPRHEVLEEVARKGVKIPRVRDQKMFPTPEEIKALQEKRDAVEQKELVVKFAKGNRKLSQKCVELQKAKALLAQARADLGLPPLDDGNVSGLNAADAEVLAAADKLLKEHVGSIEDPGELAGTTARTDASTTPITVNVPEQSAATATAIHEISSSPLFLGSSPNDHGDATAGAEPDVDGPLRSSTPHPATTSPTVPTPEIARNVSATTAQPVTSPMQLFKAADYASLYASSNSSPAVTPASQPTTLPAPLTISRQPAAAKPTTTATPTSPTAPLTGYNAAPLRAPFSPTLTAPLNLRGPNALPLGSTSPAPSSVQTSPADAQSYAALPPGSQLPQISKNGDPLRWSIKRRDSGEVEGGVDWVVNVGGLEGESGRQKRRRVGREMRVVEAWSKVAGGRVIRVGAEGDGSQAANSRRQSFAASSVADRRSSLAPSSVSRDSFAPASERSVRGFGAGTRGGGGSGSMRSASQRPTSAGNDYYGSRPTSSGTGMGMESGNSAYATPFAGSPVTGPWGGSPVASVPGVGQAFGAPTLTAAQYYGSPSALSYGVQPVQYFGPSPAQPYSPMPPGYGTQQPHSNPQPIQYTGPQMPGYGPPAVSYNGHSTSGYHGGFGGYGGYEGSGGSGRRRRKSGNVQYGRGGEFY